VSKNDGGPAFPAQPIMQLPRGDGTIMVDQGGMTLRDWFAGQALAGMLANPAHRIDFKRAHDAGFCYEVADAMLKERDR